MSKQAKNILVFLFFLLPTCAFANAGSPMVWFGILHTLVLNAFIGWVDSIIVGKFKISNRTWLIIMGNYVSMFIGLFYIAPFFSTMSGNFDFWGDRTTYGDYQLRGFIAGMITSFFATLIIEYPFFYFAVKNKLQRRQILIPFLIANILTNIIMAIVYFSIVCGGSHW